MAVGRDMRGGDENVVVVAGDAAFTCGDQLRSAEQRRGADQALHRRPQRQRVVDRQERRRDREPTSTTSRRIRPTRTCTKKPRRFIEAIAGKGVSHLAHKVEEGVKNLLAAERHLRRTRPPLLRPDRRPRHSAAHSHLRVPEDAGRAGAAAHPHEKGQGLRAGARPSRTNFTASANSRSKTGETAPAPTPDLFARYSARRSAKFAETNNKIVAITGAMPSGTGLGYFAKATSRPILRRRHRRGACRAVRLRASRRRDLKPFLDDLFDLHAARLRHDHPRHRAAESERRALHGSRRLERRRRPDAPRALRHRLSPPRARTSSTCSRRMKTNSSTCSGRWPTTMRVRSPSVTRAAPAPARSRKRSRSCSRSARPKSSSTATRCRHPRPRQHVRDGRGSRAETRGARHHRRAHQSALDQAARHRHARILRAQRAKSSARSKITSCTTASAAPSWSTCTTPDDQHAGRAHRLARSIHRARQHSGPAQEARPNERRASRKSVAAIEKTSGKGALDCGVTQASHLW